VTAYHRPECLEEALALLDEHGFDAKVLAGGQSLIPMMSAGLAAPEHLVDVNRLPGLDTLEVVDGELRIGALVRHSTLAALRAGHPVAAAAPLLPAAAPWISHEAVRNRGTMLGSLVHADPSAEWPAVALATGARLRLVRKGGERWVPAAELFLGPLTADVEPEELAVELRLPVAPPRTAAALRELAYRDGDYAVVGVAAQVTLDGHGGIADARIGLFGVDATPVRPAEAESLLVQGGPGALHDAAAAAGAEVNPGSDATASAGYRREMVPVFVRRAVAEALERASGVGVAAQSPSPER
jgi:aerobic carbon-monoxide dehydrogenase medium subunit